MDTSAEVRQRFLDFFASRATHQSFPRVPWCPATTRPCCSRTAGMVQFKDVFLGKDEAQLHPRRHFVQRCVRAGGKHNDLENVGYTARHHTFFEMLGNFSFGDYFKQDAIHFAWELLTVDPGLPKEKLWVTVYETDDEAFDLWLEGRSASTPLPHHAPWAPSKSDNFWSMGDTGPCGPCTEIFYDHGEHIPGGPPGNAGRCRRRPLRRDLEPGVHAVRPGRRWRADAAARSPPSTRAWAWSASPRCCSTCIRTTRSTCSRT